MATRKLLLSVLVVDDEVSWCKDFCRQLTSISKRELQKSGTQKAISNPVELSFVPFTPYEGEGARDFVARFTRVLQNPSEKNGLKERIQNLCCIVIDLELGFKRNTEQVQAPQLAEIARTEAPSIIRFLLTNYDPDDIVSKNHGLFDKPVRKPMLTSPGGHETFAGFIAEKIKYHLETPYWTALEEFATADKIVLHALANTDQRTRLNSVSTDAFSDFVGRGYFRAEASSTVAPLGSLLHTGHSLFEAENRFASAFGASIARFVTGGTTTANKIVHLSLCRQGDLVLLDRFCHISHHHAVALARSWPVYLDARFTHEHGIPAQITSDAATTLLDDILSTSGRDARLPRLIALTNCTFDGLTLDPRYLFTKTRAVLSKHGVEHRLKEIAFLFDEAWFGFARFHPQYARFSSLTAKQQLANSDVWWGQNLRVYVTQSVHKTLSAFRQGSVILISDPTMDGIFDNKTTQRTRQRFDTAFSTFTTTSPHAGMLASMDVGRRQIVLEGRDLIDGMIQRAIEFRGFVNELGKEFPQATSVPSLRVLAESDLISKREARDGIILDTSKITISAKPWLTGTEMRSKLWSDYQIQVNKVSDHSVLCLFTIGIDRQQVTDLKDRFRSFLKREARKSAPGLARHEGTSRARFPARQVQYYSTAGVIEDPIVPVLKQDENARFDPSEFLLSRRDMTMEFLPIDGSAKAPKSASNERLFVAAAYVVPYPPGYPVLIPGQVVTEGIVRWLASQTKREIHGLAGGENARSIPVYSITPRGDKDGPSAQ